ncbi:hypothetical protein SO802_022979 [Lithocarpus litseifolius]|uniref:Thymidine kinase n=1 Tax=Lithocarpus litseifolius TaxID=425828 RepID=A0AAW2C4Y6_9ROSI
MPRGEGEDQLVWRLNTSGVFDVRSFYKLLSSPTTNSFPWECIWRNKVPKRVSFFLWTAANDGILTMDNLIKKCQFLDTRYGLDSIVTHDGVKLPCLALPDLSPFRQKFGLDAYDQLDVIGIDEAQFFEDLYDFCREAADHDGKRVIVAGLDGNYLRRSFGSVLDIIPLADSVTKLAARCELCSKRAFFTLRKTEETQTELIGGADVYMPVCRQHYVSGQVVKEAAKTVLESQNVQCVSYA